MMLLILKPALSRGNLKVIGATTNNEYRYQLSRRTVPLRGVSRRLKLQRNQL